VGSDSEHRAEPMGRIATICLVRASQPSDHTPSNPQRG
jgi:hypothetical protein